MRSILLATDFSETAQHAVEYALLLFGDEQCEFLLFNSVHRLPSSPDMLISIEDLLSEQSKQNLAHQVTELKQRFQSTSLTSMSTHGDPSGVIRNMVKKHPIDIVVMGTQGRSALNEVFLGSNTRNLVNTIAKPLLIVPPDYPLRTPKKIVFGTDLVQVENLDLLNPMIYLAKKYQAEITILNITGDEEQAPVRHALHQLDFNRHFAGISYHFEVVHHLNPLEGILKFVARERVDMLVLLPKQYPLFRRLFHRSLTREMLNYTEIPLLVV